MARCKVRWGSKWWKSNTAAFTFTTVDIDPLENQRETNGRQMEYLFQRTVFIPLERFQRRADSITSCSWWLITLLRHFVIMFITHLLYTWLQWSGVQKFVYPSGRMMQTKTCIGFHRCSSVITNTKNCWKSQWVWIFFCEGKNLLHLDRFWILSTFHMHKETCIRPLIPLKEREEKKGGIMGAFQADHLSLFQYVPVF